MSAAAYPAGPSRLVLQALPFTLDSTCPVALPSKPVGGTIWPFECCGPDTYLELNEERPAAFLRRRYLETLFLSDVSGLIILHRIYR
jgi:hypothetical protein